MTAFPKKISLVLVNETAIESEWSEFRFDNDSFDKERIKKVIYRKWRTFSTDGSDLAVQVLAGHDERGADGDAPVPDVTHPVLPFLGARSFAIGFL